MDKAFQDCYAEAYSHCYGCGRHNPHGHQLKSHWDGEDTVARFTPGAQYSGGVPQHVYGGLIASLMDCHGTASAAAFACRAAQRDMDTDDGPPRHVTASLKVDFLRPAPMGAELTLRGALRSLEGRKVRVELTLYAQGEICARGEMLAVRYPA